MTSGNSGSASNRSPAQVIRGAIHTSRHAQMLFDMVVSQIGDQAVVESADGGTRLTLYRREGPDSDRIIPWPLLRLGTKGRLSTVITLASPLDAPDKARPRPGRVPKLRNLGPGEIEIHDGPSRITVTYGEDGRWMETSRSANEDAHAGVIEAVARGGTQPTELLATYVAGLDTGVHGSARVLRPAPLPGGIGRVWNCGLFAARDALFDERIPPDATCAIADGFSGAALAWGASPEVALGAWREMVEIEQPEPHIPESPPEPERDSVERREEEPGRFSALVRRGLDGCTIIGERLVEMIDLDEIEDVLDRADVMSDVPIGPRSDSPGHLPALNSTTVTYRFVDANTHEPVEPRVSGSRQTHGFVTRELNGMQLQWQVLRQRWVEG